MRWDVAVEPAPLHESHGPWSESLLKQSRPAAWKCPHVIDQQQPASRHEKSVHLLQDDIHVVDGAQHEGAEHGVQALVGQWDALRSSSQDPRVMTSAFGATRELPPFPMIRLNAGPVDFVREAVEVGAFSRSDLQSLSGRTGDDALP